MNAAQFRAFFWLRWRLYVQQVKRGGLTNTSALTLLAAAAVLVGGGLFVAAFRAGLFSLRLVAPTIIQYAWDGLVLAFLFSWIVGLLNELQRSEILSLDKFLHLPVSLVGAFFVNYLSSLFSLTVLLFVPTAVGLGLGLTFGRGWTMLLLLPAVAALLLMVTAVTHQFQGWLAALMANKRRRRTILVVLTMGFMLLLQAPNLISQFTLNRGDSARAQELLAAQNELNRACTAGEISRPEYDERLKTLRDDDAARTTEIHHQRWERIERAKMLVWGLLPPAWLPLGAKAAAEGRTLPLLLATLGMTLLGSISLWRSYRTTLRLYSGQFNAGRRQTSGALPPLARGSTTAIMPSAVQLLERRLPGLSEQASAVALSTFRALLRAPEIKMLLLSPVFMLVVLSPMIFRQDGLPEALRPLAGFGAMALVLLIMMGFMSNQFGFDRSGFQALMLSGARRQDILLGKNAAAAPFALGMSWGVALALQWMQPMRWDYFLAMPLELVSLYLLFSLLANMLSIYAPVNVPAGALRKARPTGFAMLLHLLFTFVFFPLTALPVLLPLGAQWWLERRGWIANLPVCPLLSLGVCALVVYVYRRGLAWQGPLLQAGEPRIYAIVRTREE